MDSVLIVVESPIFLGTLLILGLASLIRILLSRDPSIKRHYRGDRRNPEAEMPGTPFIDSTGSEVTEDRRKLIDRRRTQILARQDQESGSD